MMLTYTSVISIIGIYRYYRLFTFIGKSDIVLVSIISIGAVMKQVLSNPDQAGHIITSRRNALNLSQKAVAAKLGISQNRLSELEEDASRLTLERFIALANLLGLELVIQNKPAKQNSESEW